MQQPAKPCVSVHSFTHIGQQTENQDRLAILHSQDGDATLLVVADGLGGHRGGALAAQTVVDGAARCWETYSADQDAANFLRQLVHECDAAVHRLRHEHNRALHDVPTGQPFSAAPIDPHSTLAALLITGDTATSIHAGDSRVLQFSDDELVERTLDHSVAQLHVLRGMISDEEMATHPDQNVVFSQIGGSDSPETELKHWDLAKARRFVLCSDGFWEIFRPEEMLELFSAPDPEKELSQRFERKLEGLHQHDNTTVILAEVKMAGEAVPARSVPEASAGEGHSVSPSASEEANVATNPDRQALASVFSKRLAGRPILVAAALLLALVVALLLWTGNDQIALTEPETVPPASDPVPAPSEVPPARLESADDIPVVEGGVRREDETASSNPNPIEAATEAAKAPDTDEVPASSPNAPTIPVSVDIGASEASDPPPAAVEVEPTSADSDASHTPPAMDAPAERPEDVGEAPPRAAPATKIEASPPALDATPSSATRSPGIGLDTDTGLDRSSASLDQEEGSSAAGAEEAASSEADSTEDETTPSRDEATAEDTPDAIERSRTRPVPLESTNLELDVPIESGSEPTDAAAEELRRRDRLGDEDVLQPSGSQEIGDSVVSSSRQRHQDIPVYGAEVRVVVRDGRIVSIRGQPARDIHLDTTIPAHDYPSTIALAETLLAHDITPEDEGLLVIFATPAAYRLAWQGTVVIDQLQEEAVFDAETGEVLLRVPLVHNTEDASADGTP